MANPLKCDLCTKPATVHLTQIVNNKVHKVDLCEECAQAKGVTDPSGFSLADLLLKASLNPEPVAAGVRCEQCGFTQNDFKKHTQNITEMKRDLEVIFKRIRGIKAKLAAQLPEAYSQAVGETKEIKGE